MSRWVINWTTQQFLRWIIGLYGTNLLPLFWTDIKTKHDVWKLRIHLFVDYFVCDICMYMYMHFCPIMGSFALFGQLHDHGGQKFTVCLPIYFCIPWFRDSHAVPLMYVIRINRMYQFLIMSLIFVYLWHTIYTQSTYIDITVSVSNLRPPYLRSKSWETASIHIQAVCLWFYYYRNGLVQIRMKEVSNTLLNLNIHTHNPKDSNHWHQDMSTTTPIPTVTGNGVMICDCYGT